MSDDLRVRVVEILSVNSAHNRDRAIAIVWNEAIEAAVWEVETTGRQFFSEGVHGRSNLTTAIRALRKPEGGG